MKAEAPGRMRKRVRGPVDGFAHMDGREAADGDNTLKELAYSLVDVIHGSHATLTGVVRSGCRRELRMSRLGYRN